MNLREFLKRGLKIPNKFIENFLSVENLREFLKRGLKMDKYRSNKNSITSRILENSSREG